MAVFPRRDFPSFSPRLIESVRKQSPPPPTYPTMAGRALRIVRNREKNASCFRSKQGKLSSLLCSSASSPRRFPIRTLSVCLKRVFDDRPFLSALLSDQVDNLIYLRLSNELVAARSISFERPRMWHVDDARIIVSVTDPAQMRRRALSN